MNPDDVRIFARVAESLSFRRAAMVLGIARSTVSKRLASLEQELGVTLLNRSSRQISLTDAGSNLLEYWQSIETSLENARHAIQGADDQAVGWLRVSLPTCLGAALIPELVTSFLAGREGLSVHLDLREQYVDIIGEGFDVVIRVAAKLPDSQIRSRRIASSRSVFAASPGYLRRFGVPARMADLAEHNCLSMSASSVVPLPWPGIDEGMLQSGRLNTRLTSNNDYTLVLASCLDAGIVCLPEIFIAGELHRGQLALIEIADAVQEECGVFALYPRSPAPVKVKEFVAFVQDRIATLPTPNYWMPTNEAAG